MNVLLITLTLLISTNVFSADCRLKLMGYITYVEDLQTDMITVLENKGYEVTHERRSPETDEPGNYISYYGGGRHFYFDENAKSRGNIGINYQINDKKGIARKRYRSGSITSERIRTTLLSQLAKNIPICE